MAYLSTDPNAGQPINSTQPVQGQPPQQMQGGTLAGLGQQQGNPAMGGFIVPPGSLPTPQLSPNGPGKTDNSFDASDPVTQAIQAGLQSGLTGDMLINFVKQRFPQANISWDAQRGNVDYGTGGSNGIQFDTNAQGVWGAHPYDDAGTSGGLSGLGSGSLWNALPTEQQALNMPGAQYGIDEANRALQAGAAAKGTLLNGRTQQALQSSLFGTALNQSYLPLAQLQLGYNQANVGNLQNLASMGLNATSVGSQ